MQWLESRQDQVEGGGQVRADEGEKKTPPPFSTPPSLG